MKYLLLSIFKNLIFVIVFNVIFFVVCGVDNTASVWISYAAIHIAYIALIVSPKLRSDHEHPLLTDTTVIISIVYFIIELIAGIVFISLQDNYFVIAISVQLSLLGVYGIILIINVFANRTTTHNLAIHSSEVGFIKNNCAVLELIMKDNVNDSVKPEIEKLYYLIHSSPAHSSPAVKEIEADISSNILELKAMLLESRYEDAKRLIEKVRLSMEERNIKNRE